jgi:hypothetical protein
MRICSVENCGEKHIANGFCNKHNLQFKKYGEIPERTIKDPNEFIIDGDICWVILYNRYCMEVARAKFYTFYYESIKTSKLKWSLNNYGYVYANWFDENGKQHQVSLHQAIIQLSDQEVPEGHDIDHKDGDKLNNLNNNLRICTPAQNQQNRGKNKNNTSGYKGVMWDNPTEKWRAQIRINNKNTYLGVFSIIEDAARAYNAVALQYFGEFAILNDV